MRQLTNIDFIKFGLLFSHCKYILKCLTIVINFIGVIIKVGFLYAIPTYSSSYNFCPCGAYTGAANLIRNLKFNYILPGRLKSEQTHTLQDWSSNSTFAYKINEGDLNSCRDLDNDFIKRCMHAFLKKKDKLAKKLMVPPKCY